MNSPIFICASGNSIPFLNSSFYKHGSGFPIELERIIKYNYSIGLNYFFKYGVQTTWTSFCDWQFYEDNLEDLKKIPLIIGCDDPSFKSISISDKTILLKDSPIFHGEESIIKGVYCKQLVGIFSLSLAIGLGFKEIYLLGFDACEINGQAHFYQGVADLNKKTPIYLKGKLILEREHFRGVGKHANGQYKTSTYQNKRILNETWFAPFKNLKDINIFNVSPNSAIDVFQKITYDELYKKIHPSELTQIQMSKTIQDKVLSLT
jgi:hypothetical protein